MNKLNHAIDMACSSLCMQMHLSRPKAQAQRLHCLCEWTVLFKLVSLIVCATPG